MYLDHFGLLQHPFSLTPDTEFFVDFGDFKNALDVLEWSLLSGEGITKITGVAGCGKTMLCHKLIHSLDDSFHPVYFQNPLLRPMSIHSRLADELGIECGLNTDLSLLLDKINTELLLLREQGKRIVLLLDEAQSLSDEILDTLRLFSNLETEKCKLVQIVLFGQLKLDDRLKQENMLPLLQRTVFTHNLRYLTKKCLVVYIQHRLQVAGYRGSDIFSPDGLAMLHTASAGVPRMVNVLAHKAMLVAFGRGDTEVRRFHVKRAIADTDSVIPITNVSVISNSFSRMFNLKTACF